MPSIVICDDHRVFGESMAVVLAGHGYDVVACVVDPVDGLDAAGRHRPNVYLTDVRFSGFDGIDSLPAVLAHSPETRAVVLTGLEDEKLASRAKAAGALGLVHKDRTIDQIVAVINAVAAGVATFHLQDCSNEDVSPHIGRDQGLRHLLTEREREVLERLVQGQATASIAQEMGVAYSTTRTHIQNVLTKLGVHSKLEAVALTYGRESFRLSNSDGAENGDLSSYRVG